MNQIYEMARMVNQLALLLILGLVLVLVAEPRLAGHWQAERDIVYDTLWMAHVADCDCTQSFD